MNERRSDFGPSQAIFDDFVAEVWDHHRESRRDLPWRCTFDPYEILVSEIMLQQTQVARVLDKYPLFLSAFPTVAALASADVGAVLAVWQGLGYNRRALALYRAAKAIVEEHGGTFPDTVEGLRKLPGVGEATAAAVSAFAFGRGQPFIETNIRAAYIHFFFPGQDGIPDAAILPLVQATIDPDDPREWFYALMDYGVWVKRTYGNPSRRSRHHTVQSRFAGSRREVRAGVLQAVLAATPAAVEVSRLPELLDALGRAPEELADIADELAREGFLEKTGTAYRIAGSAQDDISE